MARTLFCAVRYLILIFLFFDKAALLSCRGCWLFIFLLFGLGEFFQFGRTFPAVMGLVQFVPVQPRFPARFLSNGIHGFMPAFGRGPRVAARRVAYGGVFLLKFPGDRGCFCLAETVGRALVSIGQTTCATAGNGISFSAPAGRGPG